MYNGGDEEFLEDLVKFSRPCPQKAGGLREFHCWKCGYWKDYEQFTILVYPCTFMYYTQYSLPTVLRQFSKKQPPCCNKCITDTAFQH